MAGQPVTFSDTFWTFIKEKAGITHMIEEKQSYLKKVETYEDKMKRLDMLISRADYEDDKLSPSDAALAKW